jgi:ferric-dicitrate binding protein FerR (iron transport regulator)
MPKAQEFIAFAEQCEQMAKRLPEHASALMEIAAAWRRLAEKADKDSTGSSANAD